EIGIDGVAGYLEKTLIHASIRGHDMVFRHRRRAYCPAMRCGPRRGEGDLYIRRQCRRKGGREQHLPDLLCAASRWQVLCCQESGAGVRTEDAPWWDWQTGLEQPGESGTFPPGVGHFRRNQRAQRLSIRTPPSRHSYARSCTKNPCWAASASTC